MSQEKALAVMIDNPTLIKRPVLESENFIAVGFSEKRFDDFLDEHDL
jgi:arsenate reductase-like glutaredoxin family protein